MPLAGEPEVIDPHGGLADLERAVLRVLHDRSFIDDPTRALRAARYAARYGFALEPRTDELLRDTNLQFDAVATAVWSRIREVDASRPSVLRLLLVLAVLAALGAVLLARRWPLTLLAPVAVVFVLNAVFVWQSRIHDADIRVFADNRPATWSWVEASTIRPSRSPVSASSASAARPSYSAP